MKNQNQYIIQEVMPGFSLGTPKALERMTDGHIHQTFCITETDGSKYILQRLNKAVFKFPRELVRNFGVITMCLENDHSYHFAVPRIVSTSTGSDLLVYNEEYWRCFSFIESEGSLTETDDLQLVYEVSKAYGHLAKSLLALDPTLIFDTIPNFHDPRTRTRQLHLALNNGNKERIKSAKGAITQLLDYEELAKQMQAIDLPQRVVHNDAKISNVLLTGGFKKVTAIIDFDTAMTGTVLFDFGDLVRSLACSAGEEAREAHFVRERYERILAGYIDGLGDSLGQKESENMSLGASYIIYEQALRFLADYLLNDRYYTIHHQHQNLHRAENQLQLLGSMLESLF